MSSNLPYLDPVRFVTEQASRSALRIPRPINVFQAQTTAGTVFTARDDADFQIVHLVAANTTNTADYVTVYLVPSGGAAGADNLIVYQKAVAAKDWITIFDENNRGLLQPGATLQALCGVNDAINVWGHGYDYQGVYS